MAGEERQTLSGDEEEKQRGGQQEGAGPSQAAAAAGGVFRQERLRRLVQRVIWGMRGGATASHKENKGNPAPCQSPAANHRRGHSLLGLT